MDQSLQRAPEIRDEPGKTYDSVHGTEDGFGFHGRRTNRDNARRYGSHPGGREEYGRQYIVYEKQAAYPRYLVTIRPGEGGAAAAGRGGGGW